MVQVFVAALVGMGVCCVTVVVMVICAMVVVVGIVTM